MKPVERLTPEQVKSLSDIMRTYANVQYIDLANDTPNGLQVKVRCFDSKGNRSSTSIYSMNSTGEFRFVDSFLNK